MSELFCIRGELRIAPPLKWSEIRTSAFAHTAEPLTDLALNIEREEIQTDDGITTLYACSRALPYTAEPFEPVNLREQVEGLVKEAVGHRVTGQIVLYAHDEPGDIRRIVVEEDGSVREEQAVFCWPDGSSVEHLR